MNILMANWTWYPSGGDWSYVDSVCKLYEKNGHTIIPFSMQDDRNFPSPHSKFFISRIDYKEENRKKGVASALRVLGKSIYSFEAKRNLDQLLDTVNVDVAQLNGGINNYLTPAIIPILKKRKIPVVWRILDYKLICPNSSFISNGQVCEACLKHKYYQCVLRKCKKGSAVASLAAAVESYVYYVLPHYKQVDLFLFQSEFSRDQFVKFGYDKSRTKIIENPYESQTAVPGYSGKRYILYFGRIETLKGIYTLLDAMKNLPNIELKVVGNGAEQENSIAYAAKNKISNVQFLGPKWGSELDPVLRDCEFVVIPSEWYEPSPYVGLQAYAAGKPVIAANIGGLKDMVQDQVTGLFFEPGNSESLCQAITKLFGDHETIMEMGKAARKTVETKYSPEKYYRESIAVFNALVTGDSKCMR
jgi:glycosyltransferase involved in cell wall biosynthesis